MKKSNIDAEDLTDLELQIEDDMASYLEHGLTLQEAFGEACLQLGLDPKAKKLSDLKEFLFNEFSL